MRFYQATRLILTTFWLMCSVLFGFEAWSTSLRLSLNIGLLFSIMAWITEQCANWRGLYSYRVTTKCSTSFISQTFKSFLGVNGRENIPILEWEPAEGCCRYWDQFTTALAPFFQTEHIVSLTLWCCVQQFTSHLCQARSLCSAYSVLNEPSSCKSCCVF